MQRVVYEKVAMEGFRTTKVESIAVSNNGQKMFVGTADGALVAYDCQTSLSSYSKFNCHIHTTMKSQQKEKKSVSNLTVVEGWGIVIGIVDGTITAYDLNTNYARTSLADTKGCHAYTVHEYNGIIAVAHKRKVSIYSWISTLDNGPSSPTGGFVLRKEVPNTSELPKTAVCITFGVIMGFKRSYEALELRSLTQVKVLDVDKDQRMLCLEIPQSDLRSLSILLSHGNQGLLYDQTKIYPTPSNALSNTRLEWSSPPTSIHYMKPFIISLLTDSVEIHDSISLISLQRVPLSVAAAPLTSFGSSSVIPFCFSSCEIDVSVGLEYAYVCASDQLYVLRMTPLPAQISTLLDALKFEEALNLCVLCANNPQLRDIDIADVHEKYAISLFHRGDFDAAISHFISANSTLNKVLPNFPDLVPGLFHGYLGISQQSTGLSSKGSQSSQKSSARMTGIVLTRAAAAVARYCEYYRAKIKSQVEVSEKYRTASLSAASALENLETLVVSDWEDVLRVAEIVDTVLLCSYINCSPSRRSSVIELLSSMSPINRCHIESSATMLASQGNSYSEALLWLYRSHNEHKRVLVALTEERCVGAGAWTRDQFYNWTADYLHGLWFSDDSNLPSFVLNALRPVLEYNPELGINVLINRSKLPSNNSVNVYVPPNSNLSTLGGKGTDLQDILTYFETIRFSQSSSVLTATQRMMIISASQSKDSFSDAPDLQLPLSNSKALAVTYLEWRVKESRGSTASGAVQDEYLNVLLMSIPRDVNINPTTDVSILNSDSDNLIVHKIFRKKIRYFLQAYYDYNTERALKLLPDDYVLEQALVLVRLRHHEDVIRLYVSSSHLQLAEDYCIRIYEGQGPPDFKGQGSRLSYSPEDANIFLVFIRVLLENKGVESNIPIVISIAERHFQRIDSLVFLKMLPKNVPMALLAKYLTTTIEYASTKKRTLQVVHQLLRVQEVHMRTAQYSNAT